MRDRLVHRGPDGAGTWDGEHVVLAHRRLAVLDPTPAGAQPMTSADGRWVVAYNGELYDDLAWRERLQAGGHVALPALTEDGMVFRRFSDAHCLEDGPFGTRHPNAAQSLAEPDFIVAPLAAFDRRGGRIGYGAGHYDRAIAALMASGRPLRIAGMAFACQEVEHVPVEPHDALLQTIVTERELIDTEAA